MQDIISTLLQVNFLAVGATFLAVFPFSLVGLIILNKFRKKKRPELTLVKSEPPPMMGILAQIENDMYNPSTTAPLKVKLMNRKESRKKAKHKPILKKKGKRNARKN
jgi:hypothetical protein